MTHEADAPQGLAESRRLRPARPWPFPGKDAPFVALTLSAMGMLVYGAAVIDHQANIYRNAHVATVEAGGGAAVAEALVLLGLIGVGLLYRRGYPLRFVYAGAAGTAALAVAFALLPYLVAGRSWLDTLLGFLVAITFDLLAALLLAVPAVFLPLWWERQS